MENYGVVFDFMEKECKKKQLDLNFLLKIIGFLLTIFILGFLINYHFSPIPQTKIENFKTEKEEITKERQKLLCKKLNGEIYKFKNITIGEDITSCYTGKGTYKWENDNFILEKKL